ncbi:MDR family MFS transporter [Thermoactinomyces vulgaris]|uniref:MDR family MFS transporter n=1 Tax=Thermoactinomyces vulgaris TaxID=2026 RepID=UPI00110763AA|nr:MFS transporter [Thermoactinomyces vulgaris]QCV55750.1 MFS transporter [Thermoactinomyces vulgaris]
MRIRDWDQNLKVRLFGEGLIHILFWMYIPFMSIFFADAYGKKTAGISLILSQLVSVLANLAGGYCADRYGRKKMMVIASVGEAVTFFSFALANSPWFSSPGWSFVCFTVLGAFQSIYWPASHAMIADVVAEENRNQVFATFYTASNLAVVVGPVLGGFFFFQHRFELLLASGLATLFLSVLIQKYVRETARLREGNAPASGNGRWIAFAKQNLRDYRIIFSDFNFMLFILAGILVSQTFMQLDLIIAVYVTESIPVQTLLQWGSFKVETGGAGFFSWLITENGLMVVLFTVWITKMIRSFHEKNVFVTSSLLYGLSMILLGMTHLWWLAFLAIFIFTIAEILVVGLQDSFISKLAPESMRGQYFAAASLRFSIGKTIAPAAIPLSAWVGYPWTFAILGLIAFTGAFMYHLMFRNLRHRPLPSGHLKKRGSQKAV